MTLLTILASSTAAASAAGNPVTDIALQFGVDWWKLISQIISFSIVAFLLKKFAYAPILQVLEERKQKIAEGLANAEKIKAQLADAQQQSSDILAKANADAQRIIDEARAAAKSISTKESQRAVAEAEQIVAKAREATQLEHQKMLGDLKREVARLVVGTTAKVTGKVLDESDQKRLSEEAAKEIAA
jgi:F-type H+-transporting ATPase subunit b